MKRFDLYLTDKGTLRLVHFIDILQGGQQLNSWLVRKIYGKRVCVVSESNDIIYNALVKKQSCMITRFGLVEMNIILNYLRHKHNMKYFINMDYLIQYAHLFCFNAGFFPNKLSLMWKFGEMVADRSKDIDILAIWNMSGEYFITQHICPKAKLIAPGVFYPNINNGTFWTKALNGKKVLVIHPFEKSIRSQYQKRELLFENKNILPEFELKTFKAIQTIANTPPPHNLKTWFDALSWMEDEISKIDFDIAIIGCGAYGMPLASTVKRMGKKAVHMGGATQLLFGIYGERWIRDYSDYLPHIKNANWVRPLEEETPALAKKVENGAYW